MGFNSVFKGLIQNLNRKRIIPTFVKSKKRKLSSFRGLSEKHFTYSFFQTVIIISEQRFALSHLISDLTLTCAITLMGVLYLTGCTAKTEAEVRWGRTRISFLPPCKLHHGWLQWLGSRANIFHLYAKETDAEVSCILYITYTKIYCSNF
jgi:hypothetical protein